MRLALALLIALAGCRQLLGLDRPALDSADAPRPPPPADAAADATIAPDVRAPSSITATGVALLPSGIQLTAEGTTDWAHWGFTDATSFDHKLGGGGVIGDATATTGALVMALTNVQVTASWTDGTPDAAASATGTGIGVKGSGGLTFTVPAGSTPRALHVYVGCARCTGRLDVALSDASAPPYSDDQFTSSTNVHAEYTIVFDDPTPGAVLSVTWSEETALGANDFAELLSATLP